MAGKTTKNPGKPRAGQATGPHGANGQASRHGASESRQIRSDKSEIPDSSAGGRRRQPADALDDQVDDR